MVERRIVEGIGVDANVVVLSRNMKHVSKASWDKQQLSGKNYEGFRSNMQYFRSIRWLRSVLLLLMLYVVGLGLLFGLFHRLQPLDDLQRSQEINLEERRKQIEEKTSMDNLGTRVEKNGAFVSMGDGWHGDVNTSDSQVRHDIASVSSMTESNGLHIDPALDQSNTLAGSMKIYRNDRADVTRRDESGDRVRHLQFRVPRNMEELRDVQATLELYKELHSLDVLVLLGASYMFMQMFMIPGPAVINVLVGSLYPFKLAMSFVAIVSTVGASLNYWLAQLLLKDAILALFSSRIGAFKAELVKHKSNMLNYMLFVRVTPVLPHWFVNVASPVVGIPFHVFLLATAIGHQPMNFITVQAGAALGSIQHLSDLYSLHNIMILMCIGVASLIPILWRYWIHRKMLKKKAQARSIASNCSDILPIIHKN